MPFTILSIISAGIGSSAASSAFFSILPRATTRESPTATSSTALAFEYVPRVVTFVAAWFSGVKSDGLSTILSQSALLEESRAFFSILARADSRLSFEST